jgi:hypothetical protein
MHILIPWDGNQIAPVHNLTSERLHLHWRTSSEANLYTGMKRFGVPGHYLLSRAQSQQAAAHSRHFAVRLFVPIGW